jgi:hypothetical protein
LKWGCGEFACPVNEMKRIWEEVIDEVNNLNEYKNHDNVYCEIWFCNIENF